ncbi:response regulator transcription factor [Rhizobium sp. Root482]|uniref:response regulator n=1 Tax=Rhizobium sp. Root482 TaxID=1736543 RepID=UPI0006F45286|nr:response regulator transcription factor [Rhizobium sp. Root482]KQY13772.1 two-component system response regulator [Rhizobium sp. Root482]
MRILLVEDNRALSEGLVAILRGSGYAVDVVSDGASADAVTATENFDLVILDLTLPEMDGLDVLRSMRARQNKAAVLILTARGTQEEKIRGLDLGADDYMIKPFDISEFEARVRVLLRRQAGLRSSIVSYGTVSFDLNSRTFSAGGITLDIPARELGLLEILFMRAGKVVAKEAIIQSLTAFDDDLSANAIEQYVSRLRKRLAPHGLTVRTARGIGYYLDKRVDG